MQLPLEICHKYGQFAFQDKQQGTKAITAIQDFIQDQNDNTFDNEAKTITIERNKAGTVTLAKSVKLLPNMQINLKALIHDTLGRLQETVNFSTIVIGGPLTTDSWLINVGAALYLMKFAIDLRTVELKQEQAGVLIALHHLSRGEANLEVSLTELQNRIQHNYHFSIKADKLDDILEDLIDLHCITRQQDTIYLTEKIVLQDKT